MAVESLGERVVRTWAEEVQELESVRFEIEEGEGWFGWEKALGVRAVEKSCFLKNRCGEERETFVKFDQ
jgi:hypothetical protein